MLVKFEMHILALIDEMVEHANDDEFFASGYLRGHLTLSMAEVEQIGSDTQEALKHQMDKSLQDAIHTGELSPHDQALVLDMWDKLYVQAQQPA